MKFPVFSLMIREFDAESSSHQTARSGSQSAQLAVDRESLLAAAVPFASLVQDLRQEPFEKNSPT
jgi:hypothetical protein